MQIIITTGSLLLSSFIVIPGITSAKTHYNWMLQTAQLQTVVMEVLLIPQNEGFKETDNFRGPQFMDNLGT